MFSKVVLVATALTAFVNAQTQLTSSAASVAPSSTQSQAMPAAATAGFNLNNVSSTDRFSWCLAQRNTCPFICGGSASQNDCDSTSLVYNCVCPNGTVPDCSPFIQTIPFFECQANYGQCVAAHPNDAVAQGTCTTNMKCGTRNATAEVVAKSGSSGSSSSASSSGASSASSSKASSGSASATASSSGSSAAASATKASDASMTTLTTGAFAAVLMAAFKLFL